MTSQTVTSLEAAPVGSLVARGWRATAAICTAGSRLSFVVIAWLLLVDSADWVRPAVLLAVQALAYLAGSALAGRLVYRFAPGPVAIAAELASALVIVVVAFATTNTIAVGVLVAVLGGLRALAEMSVGLLASAATAVILTDSTDDSTTPPPREGLILPGLVVAGAAAGALVAWLGPWGGLWLLAMVFGASAARVGLAGPGSAPPPSSALVGDIADERVPAEAAPPGGPTASAESEAPADDLAGVARHPLTRRLVVSLALTALFGVIGSMILVAAWIRDVFASSDSLGLVGGAFILGAVSAAVVFTAAAGPPLRYLALAVGFLAGGGAVAVIGDLPPVQLVVVAVALMAGIATASVTPVVSLGIAPSVPAAARGRLITGISALVCVAVVAAGFVAAWVVTHASLPYALGAAAASLLAAMLVPVFGLRTWEYVLPQLEHPVTVVRRTPKLSGRLAVTLAYADGEWLVEVRRGRALLGSRYLVKPAEAMSMLSLLGVPALNNRVEEALTSDRTEATRQVDRMRVELAELEAKLTRLTDMVDTDENAKP